ncbi:MAG: tetratricopeptide repeat protein [Saprospiraceae bacterium]|nr:tetratricopeptide repeat protein [Saprospiraceae bacterium]
MMRFALLFYVILWAVPSIYGQHPNQQLDEANKFYQSKKYEDAIKNYKEILSNGHESGALYYNLGNAYYRTNEIGKAILNYERALVLLPNDTQTKHNLKIANGQQKDQIEAIEPFFLIKWWSSLRQIFSSTIWSIITLVILWAAVAGFGLWLFATDRLRKKQGFLAGIIALLVSILPLCLAISKAAFEKDTAMAIVLADEISLRSAPDADSQKILSIHEGVKITLLDQIADWYKVRLGDGEQGWLPKNSFEKI